MKHLKMCLSADISFFIVLYKICKYLFKILLFFYLTLFI